jgi:AcrR family transcriptional regulator
MRGQSAVRSRTQQAILTAAKEAFRELGFDQASIDEIARRANVARGTLYYNFVSKEDIAVGIAEQYRAQGYAQLLEQRAAGADTLTMLDNFFAFAGKWIAENRDAAFIGTTAAIRGVGRASDRPGTTEVFEDLVAQGQAEGVFRTSLPASTIARLLASLLTQAALLGPDSSNKDASQWPRLLLHMAIEGIRPRDDDSPPPPPTRGELQ